MITDEQIKIALADYNGWRGAPLIPGIDQSESMQKLLRCWFAQVERHCSETRAEGHHQHHPYHDLMVSIAGGRQPSQAYRGWFNHFAMAVITKAMCGIHSRESLLRDPDGSEDTISNLLDERLASQLKQFSSATIEAFHKIREAEELLGLPRNYFMQRRRDDLGEGAEGIKKMFQWKRAGNSEEFQFNRLPVIEPYRRGEPDIESHLGAREALASVASIMRMYELESQHLAKRGKKSFEQWAIRKIWAGVQEPFSFIGSEPKLDKPWATVRDMLALCNVAVDSEMVRKTVNAS